MTISQPTTKNKSVAVALSGGVDSAVAAALLVQQGYAVTGFFMKNWTDIGAAKYRSATDCPWIKDYEDAQAVCQKLGIACELVHFEKEYRERVFEYFLREYRHHRTPNPDVVCNTAIKFDAFFQQAQRLGYEYMATGHYARTNQQPRLWQLQRGVDPNKDQSYFIHHLTQAQLPHIIFPIGHCTKPEVRAKAHDWQLPVANKPDSQGLCFIGDIDFPAFLKEHFPTRPGKILNVEGEILGEHRGLEYYTLGQRYGLGIGGTGPYYVCAKQPADNQLMVCEGQYHPALYHEQCVLEDEHWIAGERPADQFRCSVQVRYRSQPVPCHVRGQTIFFDYPVRAVTPGQFAVFYAGDTVLGGAVIQGSTD